MVIKLKKGYVRTDTIGPIPAYIAVNTDWNGWSCPYFTKTAAMTVMRQYNKTTGKDYRVKYLPSKDVFREYDYTLPPGEKNYIEYIPEVMKTPDGPKKLYDLGNTVWVWRESRPVVKKTVKKKPVKRRL